MIYKTIRPLVFLQDPEKAHERVINLGKFSQKTSLTKILTKFYVADNSRLNINFLGIDFKNPIGIAAGFDKNAEVCGFIESLGFGFEEIGSVSFGKCFGNERPRVNRLISKESLINNTGLPNIGAYLINENLRKRKSNFPIGVNLARTNSSDISSSDAITDIIRGYCLISQGNYLVLNISCPNISHQDNFHQPKILEELLSQLCKERLKLNDKRPFLIKLSANLYLKELENLLEVSDRYADGYVISNTIKTEKGGLSGKIIKEKSTAFIREVFGLTRKPIIGVGGVFNAHDAYEKIKAGASLIELYTGMVYEGPSIAKNINLGLVDLLERDGFDNISEAIGTEV
jgi:dihydroorotate dehydrogenase